MVSYVFADCTCGAKFNFEDGECDHGARNGQCTAKGCSFNPNK